MTKRSQIWQHFEEVRKNFFRCKKCGSAFTYCGSTTTFKKHLENKHSFSEAKNDSESNPKKPRFENEAKSEQGTSSKFVQKSIASFAVVSPTIQYEIARMVALDGFTFHQVSSSSFIQRGLKALGFKNVVSHNTVAQYMTDFAQEKRNELIIELRKMKSNGTRFAFTSDESSKFCRRYLNIIITTKGSWTRDLGLCRMEGSFPAEKIVSKLKEFLGKYELELSDVIGTCFDGASVMNKVNIESFKVINL